MKRGNYAGHDRTRRSGLCAMLALALTAACAREAPRPRAPAPALPETKARVRRTPPPPEWFWEPIDADVRPSTRKPSDLPIGESDIARLEGAARLWDDLRPEARERFRRDGVVVLAPDLAAPETDPERRKRSRSMGAFYMGLREERIPHVLTLDALFALIHLGIERALGYVEDVEVAPALEGFIEKVDARLTAEEAGAATELAGAYRIARGLVAVARALNGAPSGWRPPPELAQIVAEERGHIEGHARLAVSPLLGVPLDYARFAVPSAAARPGAYRALAWLSAAPLSLVARTEAPGAPIGVAQARTNARAAMLLARVCDREVDPTIHSAYLRLSRLFTFVWGRADDLTLLDLDELAEAAGVDVTKPADIANVVRVDKVRMRAMAGRLPAVYDGSGGTGRAGVGVRLFGGHAPVDSIALQSLVGAPVGLAREEAAAAAIDRLRKGQRVLPSTLDIAGWLGAPEARTLLHETHADAFDGYDAALSALQREREALEQGAMLHASVHGSLVDALSGWANADPVAGLPRTPATDRMRVESLLSAWTLVRHTGDALARPRPRPAPSSATELRVSGAPLPVFVEPIPEVVARLVAVVRQLRRGLEALGPVARSSTATSALVEIEDILRIALEGATHHANEEALSSADATALAALPARIAKLEEEAAADLGPVIAVVHSDPQSSRVLATATGWIEPALVLARDPAREEPVLAVGAHLAHHELVVGLDHAPGVLHGVRPDVSDAWWRARLAESAGTDPSGPGVSGTASSSIGPTRAAWVASFRWTR